VKWGQFGWEGTSVMAFRVQSISPAMVPVPTSAAAATIDLDGAMMLLLFIPNTKDTFVRMKHYKKQGIRNNSLQRLCPPWTVHEKHKDVNLLMVSWTLVRGRRIKQSTNNTTTNNQQTTTNNQQTTHK
jgi:hypothetical protein